MTAHRHEIPQPWSTLAKIVALPVGIVLIAVWGVGLGIVKLVEAPFRLARWVAEARPAWDDGVGGPTVDEDEFEDASWPR